MKTTIIEFKTAVIALLIALLAGVWANAQTPAWTVNPSDYRYDMSLYLDVTFKTQPMDYSEYIVAAFVGDECRGIAETLELPDGKQCLYMRARSNSESGETLTFRYRNKATDETGLIEGVSAAFESNGRLCYPSDPFRIVIVRYYDVTVAAGHGGTVTGAGGHLEEGTVLNVEAVPSEGHYFDKWSDDNTDNPRSITVDAVLSLTAEFGVYSYKLTYTVDGENYNESEVEYGTALTAIAEPTKEGYTFSGWEGLPATMPAQDVTVTGTFSINTYKATFMIGEETIATLDVVYNEPVVAPDAPAKEGHTFAGWQDVPDRMPAHDITVLGSYTVNKYKLTYTVDGEKYNESEVEYGTALTAIAEPTKEGYSFSGWDGLPATMPAQDVTVTGTFSINTYKATFMIGEETIATLDVVYNEPVVAPDAPAKEGHTFAGWQDVPDRMPAHDITVLGSYTVNKYKLTYTVDGEKYNESEVEYGTALTAIAEPTKEGYSFSGWEGLPATMPAQDVTVTGKFSINTYKATFMIGEETIATLDVVYNEPVVAPAAPAKEGHTFAGWQDVPDRMPAHDITVLGSYTVNKYKLNYVIDGEAYKTVEVEYGAAIVPEVPEKEGYSFSGWEGLPETMPAQDVTVTGTFSINTYKATFMIGEETIATLDVVYGQPVIAPEAPAKEGHTFAGWQDVPETMPAHDITILGSYTVNKYKLNYVIDGEAYKTVEVEYGAVIVPEVPEKEGYSFSGWEGLPETMPAQDVTVTGTFSINSYKLTVYLNDELYLEQTLEFGAKIEIPDPTLPVNCEFKGWKETVPQTMPAHDVTIHGTYVDYSGVSGIRIDDNEKVSVYTLNGQVLCKDKNWRDVRESLRSGVYIINGVKYMVR